jgi:hypothetical protein
MKKKILKYVSVFLAINIVAEICFPTVAYALTGGPSQPEVQSFEPVGTTEMVDLFSGDFVYNIPLMDVEGYPINISYHSGITMDQEASWVGLGWNINPGAITRNMRGLPDDFAGDEVTKELYMKPNFTFGVNMGLGGRPEVFGIDLKRGGISIDINAEAGRGIFYNNYRGVGFQRILGAGISAGLGLSTKNVSNFKAKANFSIAENSQNGTTLTKGVSFEAMLTNKVGGVSASVSSGVNSRSGIKSLQLKAGVDFGRLTAVGGSKISYSSQSYVPEMQVPLTNYSAQARYSMGSTLYFIYPHGYINGYFSVQCVEQSNRDRSIPAYGYLYAERGQGNGSNVLMDVNREKDGAYSTDMPSLPVASHTYDLYNISGQGVAGMYRPHRSDMGVLFDNKVSSRKDNDIPDVALSVEVGLGNLFHVGGDITLTDVEATTGKWADGNFLGSVMSFAENVEDPLYEPAYFKVAGEKTPADVTYSAYHQLGEAVAPVLKSVGNDARTSMSHLKTTGAGDSGGNEYGIDQNNFSKKRRDKRSQHIRYLSVAQSEFCVSKKMADHQLNTFYGNDRVDSLGRSAGGANNAHHISEVSVLNNGGSRYVYGIPAYNTKQHEYTFTAGVGGSLVSGLIEYDGTIMSNRKGVEDSNRDGYYHATKLPRYAHSYLLTSVLSPDYVDVNQNGPDQEDLGSYTKVNYTRVNAGYKWRVPYDAGKASYDPGRLSDPYDNKGTVLYGEKEMWYVHSVETKNYVAEFKLRPREDALGVTGEHGGANSAHRSYLVESITLYTKTERAKGARAIPVKTVHFEYDYSLCPNVPNNTGASVNQKGTTTGAGETNVNANHGKLTLRKIYFTYGSSQKSRFSTYTFKYTSDRDPVKYNNPYDIKGYDRWGNFKPNNGTPTNSEFPYVMQDSAQTNAYTQQWTLEQIDLPSGGSIHVQYESDDYAYVQDRVAMQMIKPVGFASSPVYGNRSSMLYNGSDVNNYMFIDLPSPAKSTQDFLNRYLSGIEDIYFNCLVAMNNEANEEYVRGYAELDQERGGLVPGYEGYKAWIKIKNVGFGNTGSDAHAFAKASWQYARLNLPYLVYPGSDLKKVPGDAPKALMKFLSSSFIDFGEELTGNINQKLKNRGFCKTVDLERSWVRLNNPDKKKLGGGLRVKKLVLRDNWNDMTGGASSEYGQEYDYTVMEDYDGTKRKISSGVASYEPMIGNEENPFRRPLAYTKENYIIPDDRFYIEEPFGEMFFPGASVGYSQVTVRNISHVNVKAHATGKVVNEFYTARDFPVITKQTELDHLSDGPTILSTLFSTSSHSSMTVSKGYFIELNDMHGKPKAVWTYAEPDPNDASAAEKFVSGIQYVYKTDEDNRSHLNNMVKTIQPDRTILAALVGVDVDMYSDARQEINTTESGGIMGNTDASLILPIIPPLIMPIVLPTNESDHSSFQSMTITKVMQRYGILEKTIAYQEGATITTTNEAFDAETGEVLLTITQNEFGGSIYNVSYPAHWVYDGMGPAYKNAGARVKNIEVIGSESNGAHLKMPTGLEAANYFAVGDEVHVTGPGIDMKCWIGDETGGTGTMLPYLMHAHGLVQIPVGTIVTVEVIRSGRRNMMNLPILQATSMKAPVSGSKIQLDTNARILSSQASEYSDSWRKEAGINPGTITITPYSDKPRQVFNIFRYLLLSGQLTDSLRHTTYASDNEYSSINLSFPGHEAYDTSFIYLYNQQNGYADNFNEKIAYERTVPSDLPTDNIKYILLLSESSGGYVINFSYKDTGCIAVSPGKKPVDVEFIGFGGEEYTEPGYINGRLYIRLVFGPGCSLVRPVLLERIPVYDPSYTVNACIASAPEIPNPYLAGTKGNWRKKKDLVYPDERVSASAKTNIRNDGYYKTYEPYWHNASGKWQPTSNTNTKWTLTSEVVNYNGNGMMIESRDALDRYSAVLYPGRLGSSDLTLPVAVADNAKVSQVGFDGFENWSWGQADDYPGTCPIDHWNFFQSSELNIDTLHYHTGKHSLKLTTSQEAWTENTVFNPSSYSDVTARSNRIMPFYPDRGRYVVSAWVKTNTLRTDAGNRKGYIVVSYGGSAQRDTLRPSGPIIEGWQKVEGNVEIRPSAYTIKVALKPSPSETTWFDDVRIYPFNSNMKSYVYDYYSKKLMSELDENNYAIFYEYDEQGALKRVKRETEKGIVTIKEHRSGTIKK